MKLCDKAKRQLSSCITKHIICSFTLLFVIICVIYFFPQVFFHRSLISIADGYNQYYPSFVYIGKYIRKWIVNLFHGTPALPQFDFAIGFGDNIITTLNYYGFGDVFNLISAVFPVRYSSYGYTLTIILKMYAAGLAFMYLGKNSNRVAATTGGRATLICCGLFYSFSGYSLFYGTLFPTFLQPLITMPLLVCGIDAILISREKFSPLLVLAVFFQALCGFYFLYMEVLGCVVYCIVMVCCSGITVRKSVQCFFKIAGHFLLGICMAGVLFIPVIRVYFISTRSSEGAFSLSSFFTFFSREDWIQKLIGLYQGPSGTYMNLGLGTMCVLCLICIWPSRVKRSQKVLTLIALIGYCFPVIGSIMNGFQYSVDRWIFLLYLVISCSVLEALPYVLNADKWCYGLFILISLLWTAIACRFNQGEKKYIIWVVFIWALVITILCSDFFYRRHIIDRTLTYECLLGVFLAGITGMGFFSNAPHTIGGQGFYNMFHNYYVDQDIMHSKYSKYSALNPPKDDSFYRTDIYDTALNGSIVTGTAGTSSYWSMSNANAYDFMASNMVTGGIHGSSFIMQGLEGRTALEMLLSIYYYTDDVSTDSVYKNQYYLPFGFTYNTYIVDGDKRIEDPLDRNAALPWSVILDQPLPATSGIYEQQLLYRKWIDLSFTKSMNGFLSLSNNDKQLITGTKDAYMVLNTNTSDAGQEAEYYLVFHDFSYEGNKDWVDIYADNKKVRLRRKNSYAGQQNDFMVKIKTGTVKQGKIKIKFPANGMYHLGSLEFRRLDINSYKDAYACRSKIVLQNLKIGNNMISGNIEVPLQESRLLFLSILFDSGWKCQIDGKDVPILRADDGYSAVLLNGGDHNVVLTYQTPGLTEGATLSCISALVFVIFIIVHTPRAHLLFRRRSTMV